MRMGPSLLVVTMVRRALGQAGAATRSSAVRWFQLYLAMSAREKGRRSWCLFGSDGE
jgi:hypothetical protein